MKKILLSLLLMLMTAVSWGFEADGIEYAKSSDSTVVVSKNTLGYGPANYSGDIVIPEVVIEPSTGKKYTVVQVYYEAFIDSRITSIVLPKTIKYIDQDAFLRTYMLKTVTFAEGCVLTWIDRGAFQGSNVEKIIGFPKGMKLISERAFSGCENLVDIDVPMETKIEKQAFAGCLSLRPDAQGVRYAGRVLVSLAEGATDVTVREGTTEIYADAFAGHKTLTSITFPKSLTTFPTGKVFKEAISLEKIKLPSYVTELSTEMFWGCTSLKTFDFTGITSIGSYCFATSGLESVAIPANVKTIESCAFHSCVNLSSLTLSEGLEVIGSSAFRNCTGLTEVILPSTLTEASNAFYACTGLKSVKMKGNTEFDRTFYDCTSLQKFDIPDLAEWCSRDFKSAYDNPLYYAALYVNGVSASRLVIPDGVTSIGKNAFNRCSNIISVTLPASLTVIGTDAFKDVATLYEVYNLSPIELKLYNYSSDNGYILKNVKVVHTSLDEPSDIILEGDFIFQYDGTQYKLIAYASSNTDMVTPDYCKGETYIISDRAFNKNAKLTSVTFGKGVTEVQTAAFQQCTSIKSIVLNEGLTTIRQNGFSTCSALETVVIPSTLTTAERYSFAYCTGKITVKCNVTSENRSMFDYSKFSEVEFVEGVESIYDYALYNAASVNKVSFPETLKKLGGALFYRSTKVDNMAIPEGVEEFSGSPFANCTGAITVNCNLTDAKVKDTPFDGAKFTTVRFGANVSEIGKRAFYYCTTLKTIFLPAGLTRIGASAFKGNILADIYSRSTVAPVIDATSFSDYTGTLHIPAGSKASYMASEYWSKFANIVEEKAIINESLADVDADGNINKADVEMLVGLLLNGENVDVPKYDIDANGKFSIADISALIEWLKK